jgi:hypothetical protein
VLLDRTSKIQKTIERISLISNDSKYRGVFLATMMTFTVVGSTLVFVMRTEELW